MLKKASSSLLEQFIIMEACCSIHGDHRHRRSLLPLEFAITVTRDQRRYKLPLPFRACHFHHRRSTLLQVTTAIGTRHFHHAEDRHLSSPPPLKGDCLQMSYNHHHQTYKSPFLCEQQFISIVHFHQHFTYIKLAHLQFWNNDWVFSTMLEFLV